MPAAALTESQTRLQQRQQQEALLKSSSMGTTITHSISPCVLRSAGSVGEGPQQAQPQTLVRTP